MKRLLAAFCVLLLLGLAACDTGGSGGSAAATDVGTVSANLHGNGECNSGWHFWYWMEVQKLDANNNPVGGWETRPEVPQGTGRRVDCPDDPNHAVNTAPVGAFPGYMVANLAQDTVYRFRIGAQADNQSQYVYDANGNNAVKGSAGENSLAYDGFVTDVDEGGDLADSYEDGQAMPSVSAQRSLRWRHKRHYGMGRYGPVQDPSWTEGWLKNLSPYDIEMICDVGIYVDGYGEEAQDIARGTSFTQCKKKVENDEPNPCYPRKWCVGSSFGFSAYLMNASRRWTARFALGQRPNEGCHTFFVGAHHVLECLNLRDNPYGSTTRVSASRAVVQAKRAEIVRQAWESLHTRTVATLKRRH